MSIWPDNVTEKPSEPFNKNEFMEKLLGKPFRFWCCSNKKHKKVTWIESKKQTQAQCDECGEKSPVFEK